MTAWRAGTDADALLVVTELREALREALGERDEAASEAFLWVNALEDILGLPVPAGLLNRPLPPEYERALATAALPTAPKDADEAMKSRRGLVRFVFERVDTIAAAAALAHDVCSRIEWGGGDA